MNDRIKALAKEANIHFSRLGILDGDPNGMVRYLSYSKLEEFAELIVAECMRMCEVTEMSFVTHDCDVEASGAITVKQFIAEHFGVGE